MGLEEMESAENKQRSSPIQNKEELPQRKEYYCAFTDKPAGFQKHLFNRFIIGTAHVFGLQGTFMVISGQVPLSVIIFTLLYGYFAGAGITMGAHRYWTHRTFKAKTPLRILMAYAQTAAGQGTLFKWCVDHRIHHKFTDTDSDPHNSNKGFWFSHIGWLLQKEHPKFTVKKQTLDFSDLDDDPIIRMQAKYYYVLWMPLAVFIIPMTLLHFFFPALSLYQLFCVNYIWNMCGLHFTFLVNSAAHMWGYKPYDKNVSPTENKLVAILAVGEGWHNYHHTFPWDYKAAELGNYQYNWSTMFIDFFAWIGWAYDLKTVPKNVVDDRVKRTGDINQHVSGHSHDGANPWGWGDKDIPEEHINLTLTLRPNAAG